MPQLWPRAERFTRVFVCAAKAAFWNEAVQVVAPAVVQVAAVVTALVVLTVSVSTWVPSCTQTRFAVTLP